jgi:hypothetical protein
VPGRLIITGDVARYGQDINVRRLFELAAPAIERACGRRPGLWFGGPVSDAEWMARYEAGPYEVPGIDDAIVIGFELPPCAKRSCPRWIDVRLHPYRFAGEMHSVVSNIPGVAEAVARHAVAVQPTIVVVDRDRSLGVVALQCSNDAAILREGRMLSLADFAEPLKAWASRSQRIVIAPHPSEPESPWTREALEMLPAATVAKPGIYAMLSRAARMACISSSCGVEAPLFGCEPTFLWRAPEHSPPVSLQDENLWRKVLRCTA